MRNRYVLLVAVLIALIPIYSCKKGGAAVKQDTAIFAGGCFWCVETPFDTLDGVISAESGYTGGRGKNPTYAQVSTGLTGHYEAVKVVYDPSKVTYEDLLAVYWAQIDPTDPGGQFADRGSQYKTAIFYLNDDQKAAAERSRDILAGSKKFSKPTVTEIIPAKEFYLAEAEHQNYCLINPLEYKLYKEGSGREGFLKKTWGSKGIEEVKKLLKEAPRGKKLSKEELKKKLTPLQYEVTQDCSTESAFNNAYWNNKEEGIYVDIVTGEPLFSSTDKYDSGTGWPSFTKPLVSSNVKEIIDKSFGMIRTEVKSSGGSHLGHLFDDGPNPTGMRYCINSASLRFIPKSKLKEEGYGEYLGLFAKK